MKNLKRDNSLTISKIANANAKIEAAKKEKRMFEMILIGEKLDKRIDSLFNYLNYLNNKGYEVESYVERLNLFELTKEEKEEPKEDVIEPKASTEE